MVIHRVWTRCADKTPYAITLESKRSEATIERRCHSVTDIRTRVLKVRIYEGIDFIGGDGNRSVGAPHGGGGRASLTQRRSLRTSPNGHVRATSRSQ